MVCPRGDDSCPQARALYQSIGFKPGTLPEARATDE